MSNPVLCKDCKSKQFDMTVRGTCQAPYNMPAATLPADHTPWTESPSFILCAPCATKLGLCQACQGPLSGSGGLTVPTDKQFCRQFPNNNGNHVKGMYVGEQILAQMMVDLYSGKLWRIKTLGEGVKFYGQRLIRDGNSRYGYQELYFDLTDPNAKAVIELEERYSSSWSWFSPPANSTSTWKITVEIMR
jgi:hypothetical protein